DREQQVWTYRYGEAKADVRPLPPVGVRVTTTGKSAKIEWDQSPSANVAGYTVYRGEGAKPWLVDYKKWLITPFRTNTAATDDNLKPDTVCHYFVRANGRDGGDSADSVHVRAQPRVVEDAVVSVLSAKEVKLTWKASPNPDVTGYHVERAVVE